MIKNKKLLIIFVLIDLFLLGVLYFLFFRPIVYKKEVINGIVSQIPDWNFQSYSSATWKGRVYRYFFSRLGIYWFNPSEPHNFYSGWKEKMERAIYKTELELYDKGNFYYLKKGEKGAELVVLFLKKNKIYLITLSTSNLFIIRHSEILKKILVNLEIEGEKVSRKVEAQLDSALENIPIPITKRGEFVLIMITGILILTQAFILTIFMFIGKCPKELDKDIIICSSNSYVETRTPFQIQVQPACICLKPGYLVVYVAGKKTMEISLDDIEWNLKKKQGKYQNNIFKIPEIYEWRIHLPLRGFEI